MMNMCSAIREINDDSFFFYDSYFKLIILKNIHSNQI